LWPQGWWVKNTTIAAVGFWLLSNEKPLIALHQSRLPPRVKEGQTARNYRIRCHDTSGWHVIYSFQWKWVSKRS